MHYNKSDKNAFSLIEMLVVIAIISILSALLLPTLNKARDTAVSCVCANNLKQISLWAFSYTEDWYGVLPSNGRTSNSYTNLSSNIWFEKSPFHKKYSESTNTILICPAELSQVTPKYIEKVPNHANANSCSYGLNFFLGGRVCTSIPIAAKRKHLTGKKYWFGDGNLSNWGSGYTINDWLMAAPPNFNVTYQPWMWDHYSGGWKDRIGKGHGDYRANFIFGDGHTESVEQAEVITMDANEAKGWLGQSGW